MSNRRATISRRTALGSTLALALTSCSAEDSARGPGDAGALRKISVGLLPVVEVAVMYLGVAQGFFRARGLDVALQQFSSGAAIVPAVISGQVQFGFSNVISLLQARDKGVPLISVAGGSTSTGDPTRDFNAVMVGRTSRLESAKDLVGRKVGINSWNNIGDTTVRTAVKKDGGDAWRVQFVRMPFPQMPAQLAAGAVDAVWTPEPFRSQILGAGGRVLFDNITETYPKAQIAQYFTTEGLRRSDPGMVNAFVEGLRQSTDYASDHANEVRAIVSTYAKVPAAVAAMIVLPTWPPELDAQSTQVLGQAAHEFGTLSSAPDVAGLLGTA